MDKSKCSWKIKIKKQLKCTYLEIIYDDTGVVHQCIGVVHRYTGVVHRYTGVVHRYTGVVHQYTVVVHRCIGVVHRYTGVEYFSFIEPYKNNLTLIKNFNVNIFIILNTLQNPNILKEAQYEYT